jgi:hypothetical protein
LAIFNKTVYLPPQLISYEDTLYYLQINSSGCILYNENSLSPLYQLHEPLLLIQGVAANTQQVHLVMIKANGNLCYTLINGSEQNQTTVLAKLDVRSTRYRRLLLFPLGKTIHIFYAYAHRAIPDLWHIEHRFWNGKTWRSVNLGEVVHSREPLYDIVLDRGGNLHLLMMTFQGHQTIILKNRFNGSFYLWGNTSQTFQIQQEIIDITSIITPDNIHHLFWLAKTPSGKFDLGWAYRSEVQEIAGNWLKAPAALQTLNGPVKGLGAIEINGSLWLLVNAEVETLFFYQGDGWKQVLSNTPTHRHLRYVRKNNSSYYNAYWLEESHDSRTPAYHQYLGLKLTAMSAQANQSPNIPPISFPPTFTQTPAYSQATTYNQSPYAFTPSAARTFPQSNSPINPQPIDQSAYNTVQSPVATSILTSPVITQTPTENILPSIQSPQELNLPETQIQNPSEQNTSQIPGSLPNIVPDSNSPSQSTINLPQIESANQPLIDDNLQFAYTDYPDDLIPPAPEISSAIPPSFLPAYIDQPVFATQPSEESIPEDNTDSTTLPDSLPVFAPAKVPLPEPKILSDDIENLNQVLIPIITSILDPILKTIVELESQVTKILKEKDQTYQIFEQQLSELQQERKTILEKIENYLNQIYSQKESSLQKSLQKFEQQLSELQQEEQINHQKIEQLISSIQLDREEAQKHKKGFWARWFR